MCGTHIIKRIGWTATLRPLLPRQTWRHHPRRHRSVGRWSRDHCRGTKPSPTQLHNANNKVRNQQSVLLAHVIGRGPCPVSAQDVAAHSHTTVAKDRNDKQRTNQEGVLTLFSSAMRMRCAITHKVLNEIVLSLAMLLKSLPARADTIVLWAPLTAGPWSAVT
eukprot:561245-Amphidinium_carterae.3